MNRRHMVQILAVMALSPTAIATKGAAQSDKREVISSAAGVQATVAPDGVVRIAWSRTDVPVTVDGAPLAPAAGLGVRRRNIWRRFGVALTESGPRQGLAFRRRACGAASGDVRWSVS